MLLFCVHIVDPNDWENNVGNFLKNCDFRVFDNWHVDLELVLRTNHPPSLPLHHNLALIPLLLRADGSLEVPKLMLRQVEILD